MDSWVPGLEAPAPFFFATGVRGVEIPYFSSANRADQAQAASSRMRQHARVIFILAQRAFPERKDQLMPERLRNQRFSALFCLERQSQQSQNWRWFEKQAVIPCT